MNEEIEYAEMLEIPVSTVNVIRKSKDRAESQQTDSQEPLKSPYAVYSSKFFNEERLEENENGEGRYEGNESFALGTYEGMDKKNALIQRILKAEFAVSCALCLGIFLTNVWVKDSAINTFFRSIHSVTASTADARTYTDFTLSPIVSTLSDAELTLSPTGILTFTENCCVYPIADGKVASVQRDEEGLYTVKLAYSDSFTSVISGLDYVYYTEGDQLYVWGVWQSEADALVFTCQRKE